MAIRVCPADELPPGSSRIIKGGRFGIGVFNRDGDLYAIANFCPHDGAPVCLGAVTGTTESDGSYRATWIDDGRILRCPWHGWEFDMRTGRSVVSPTRRVKTYPVRVEDGCIVVED